MICSLCYFCWVHFLVDILNIITLTVCVTQNSNSISLDERTTTKKRLILSRQMSAIFFPGMRNDVLRVMQYLGSRSVTSDFHARSQTIPCEICDRCHRERLCSENSSSVLYTSPQQIRGSHWFIHHQCYINISNDSVVKHYYHLFLLRAKLDICTSALFGFGKLISYYYFFPFTMVLQAYFGPRVAFPSICSTEAFLQVSRQVIFHKERLLTPGSTSPPPRTWRTRSSYLLPPGIKVAQRYHRHWIG
jgi:hypothetical protein